MNFDYKKYRKLKTVDVVYYEPLSEDYFITSSFILEA